MVDSVWYRCTQKGRAHQRWIINLGNGGHQRTQLSKHGVGSASPIRERSADRLQNIFLSNSVLKNDSSGRPSAQDTTTVEKHERSSSDKNLSPSVDGGHAYTVRRVARGLQAAQRGDEGWITSMINGIDKAVLNHDCNMLLHEWTVLQRMSGESIFKNDSSNMDRLYMKFLSACFALREATIAVAAWNLMIANEHPLHVGHWTAMIHGCTKAQDTKSMNGIWTNMHKSGIEADNVAWAAYIRGLIKCGKLQEGLNAMNELGRHWKQTASAVPGDVMKQPGLPPVNAALDALVDIEKYDMLASVLQWAEKFDIRPNTYTYNILLRPLARSGDMQVMQQHLESMMEQGCHPDTTTFTIILSSMITSPQSSFRSLSQEAQKEAILSIIAMMEQQNIPPNAYTYSTIISSLLKPVDPRRQNQAGSLASSSSSSSNDPTKTQPQASLALEILSHMRSRSIQPTSHIYTVLLSHYFSLFPPNLPAIRSIWTSIADSRHLTDTIVFDRMIEGLADADQIDDAMALLKQMAREGKAPGWVALGKYLDALCRVEDWRGVKWLVDEVERGEKGWLMRWGQRGYRAKGKWERSLVRLKAMGVLDEKG